MTTTTHRTEAAATRLNAGLERLGQTLNPVLSSIVDRYGQDTYGLSALRHWVPSLAQADRLQGSDPASGDHMLCWGKLVRERNRVTDALLSERETVEEVLVDD